MYIPTQNKATSLAEIPAWLGIVGGLLSVVVAAAVTWGATTSANAMLAKQVETLTAKVELLSNQVQALTVEVAVLKDKVRQP